MDNLLPNNSLKSIGDPYSSDEIIWNGGKLLNGTIYNGMSMTLVDCKLANYLLVLQDSIDTSDIDLKCLGTCPEDSKSIFNIFQLLTTKACTFNCPSPVPPPDPVVNVEVSIGKVVEGTSVIGQGIYPINTVINMFVTGPVGSTFTGWYINGIKVSNSFTYSFTAIADTVLYYYFSS